MALKSRTHRDIPEAGDFDQDTDLHDAARAAAVNFEVLKVWKSCGVVYMRVENTRTGKVYELGEKA